MTWRVMWKNGNCEIHFAAAQSLLNLQSDRRTVGGGAGLGGGGHTHYTVV